jgi:hypothetical protein
MNEGLVEIMRIREKQNKTLRNRVEQISSKR